RPEFQALVPLGTLQPPRAGPPRGGDAQASLGQHPDVLSASHHQRRGRVDQREDPDRQAPGTGLPQPRALPQRHLLPLRRARSLSGHPARGLMNLPTRFPEDPTFFDNAYSAIAATRPGGDGYPFHVSANIGFGNKRWGLQVNNVVTGLGCNDW